MSRTFRVGPLDKVRADSWIVTGMGPLKLPPVEVVEKILSQLAALGPQTRVALTPSSSSRSWSYGDFVASDHVEVVEPCTADDVDERLADLARRYDGEGIRICLAGDFLLIVASHGLSDARMIVMVQYSIILAQAGLWTDAPPERFLLPKAVVSFFGRDPRRLVKLFRLPRAHSSREITWRRPDELPTPRPAVRWTTLSAEAVTELLARAAVQTPAATRATIVFSTLARALAKTGVRVSDTAHVLVDARRYRSSAKKYNGVFAVGLEFAFPAPYDPEQLAGEVQSAIDAGRPLAAMSLAAAKATLDPRQRRLLAVSDSAIVAYSDVGKIPFAEHLPWLGEPHAFLGMVEPFGHTGISFLTAEMEGRVRVCCSFDEGAHSPAQIEAALECFTHDCLELQGAAS
jgi:hypothetical protein